MITHQPQVAVAMPNQRVVTVNQPQYVGQFSSPNSSSVSVVTAGYQGPAGTIDEQRLSLNEQQIQDNTNHLMYLVEQLRNELTRQTEALAE